MRVAFVVLQLIDGFTTTRDHAAGQMPAFIDHAGVAATVVEYRWRTAWGSLELLTARRSPTSTPPGAHA
jgi:hypothetical protein